MVSGAFYLLACAAASHASPPRPNPFGRPDRVSPGVFSQPALCPPELQFSCFGMGNAAEKGYAARLNEADADPADRLAAARALWRGRSRRHASDVLKFVAGPPPGGAIYRAFQREVEASLQPRAVLRELQEGDYLWGTWLAFLRPHADLVPALLAGLKGGPKSPPRPIPETMLALGNSGDPRALNPAPFETGSFRSGLSE